MEPIIPSNYIPQGKPRNEDGFGYISSKNQYDWLSEGAMAIKRYDDMRHEADKISRGYVREQKEIVKYNEEIIDYYNRTMNNRIEKPFSVDGRTDESSHQDILKFSIY